MIRRNKDGDGLEIVNVRTGEVVLAVSCEGKADVVDTQKALEFAFAEAHRVGFASLHLCEHAGDGIGYDERGPWWITRQELVEQFGEPTATAIAEWLKGKKRYEPL